MLNQGARHLEVDASNVELNRLTDVSRGAKGAKDLRIEGIG